MAAATAPTSGRSTLAAAELGLAALIAAVIWGYAKVFRDWDFIRPLAGAAISATAVSWGARRLRIGLIVSLIANLTAMAVVLGITFYRDTTFHLIPTNDTWQSALDELQAAIKVFTDVKTPVPATGGFIVAAAIGIWIVVVLADTFAFRARAGVEALVPPAAFFIVGALVGADRVRVPSAVVFVGAALVFLGIHRAWIQQTSPGWLPGHQHGAAGAMVANALALVAAALAIALLTGPNLPGAGDKALVDYQGGHHSKRVTLSPIVDIRGRIVGQSTAEAFRVRSPQASYWRLTTYNIFDGERWSGDTSFTDVASGQELPGAPPKDLTSEVLQQFTLTGLRQDYLPVAATPLRINGVTGLGYAKQTSSVLLPQDRPNPNTYTVVSREFVVSQAQLEAAKPGTKSDVSAEFFTVPANLPSVVRDTANDVTASATTAYGKARALQDWFRSNFTYNLDFRAPSGVSPLVSFLQIRQGYCEQFSGTFAAMARALGLPARVAVGFTPGIQQADGSFIVQGRHAHAWPEVYFKGVGWVPFEPTPSRGIPGAAQAWTGVAPAQEGQPAPVAAPATTNPSAPTTVAGGPTTVAPPKSTRAEAIDPATDTSSTSSPWPNRLLTLAVALVAAAVVWVVALAAVRSGRRRRRRATARSAADHVLVAWAETVETLARAGLGARASETPAEYAARIGSERAVDAAPLVRLAESTTRAAYAADVDGEDPDQAMADAEDIAARVRATAGMRQRLGWAVTMRPPVRRDDELVAAKR
jgi:hypothetical protein